MLDTKTACLLRGLMGVIFGFLALMLPEPVLITFKGLFLILMGLGIALLLFLAITSRSDESMLWFGLSAVFIVIIILSAVFSDVVGLLFILIIAAVAVYNGFYDITLAMTHPKTKYIVIPAMVLSGLALLCFFYFYFPNFHNNLAISVVGTFAFAFGLFSIGMGYYKPEPDQVEDIPEEKTPRVFRWPEGKK
jgi:hypothetical protein